MSIEKPYQPSPEEIKKAEEMKEIEQIKSQLLHYLRTNDIAKIYTAHSIYTGFYACWRYCNASVR